MSTTAGYNGDVEWAGANANFALNAYQWNITYEAGEGETTDWTQIGALAGQPKTFIPLTTEWSGSFNCRLDSATAVPAVGTAVSVIKLLITGGNFGYSGDAFSTSINVTNDANGMPELVVNFRGSGVLIVGAV